MKRFRKILTSPMTIGGAFALAVLLLGASSIGGARAALTYYSDTYASQLELHDIGVSLVENGTTVSSRDYNYETADGTWNESTGALLTHMLDESDGTLQLGRNYTEQLAVTNSGTIDTYVRVTLYRYWTDEDGSKTTDIDPAVIRLGLTNLTGGTGEQCWFEDTSAATDERTVLYYNRLLASGETTPLFAETLRINGDIASHVRTQTADGVTTSTYEYNGYHFVLEATVDAVQDHNAEAAILSAWGVEAVISDGVLTLQ